MKLTRKMTLGMLATAAVVTLPVAAVVSCGDDSKDNSKNGSTGTNTGSTTGTGTNTGSTTGTGTNTGSNTSTDKFDFEITSKTTIDEFKNKLMPLMAASGPIASDFVIKIGKDLVKIEKGADSAKVGLKLQNELFPKIQVINKTLADEITKLSSHA
ncbi:hypothetical protein MYMA111404_03135 [Mycoplasma marinum]|uniref:Variable surface lipoprotein n=1 Tax=Mycoplasma marinum TaxID=1937190 RepID=A0A4V6N9K2_9MOLU|nr:hypothetical protein [Mycoplasma marinum]TCG11188.1 hypothetical protein C4B24_02800 [Mycoplasma marinum]